METLIRAVDDGKNTLVSDTEDIDETKEEQSVSDEEDIVKTEDEESAVIKPLTIMTAGPSNAGYSESLKTIVTADADEDEEDNGWTSYIEEDEVDVSDCSSH